MSCIFCENREIKNRVVAENARARAFLTNIPVVSGHVLVAPIRCVARFEDLTKEEVTAILELCVKVAQALTKVFEASRFNFAWNEGETAGQSVAHFHLHILPRKKGDLGVLGYDPRKFLYRPGTREIRTDDVLMAISNEIKKALT